MRSDKCGAHKAVSAFAFVLPALHSLLLKACFTGWRDPVWDRLSSFLGVFQSFPQIANYASRIAFYQQSAQIPVSQEFRSRCHIQALWRKCLFRRTADNFWL